MFGSSLFIFMIIDINFRLCFLKNSEDFIILMFVIFVWILDIDAIFSCLIKILY
jgi:hypothetical protein